MFFESKAFHVQQVKGQRWWTLDSGLPEHDRREAARLAEAVCFKAIQSVDQVLTCSVCEILSQPSGSKALRAALQAKEALSLPSEKKKPRTWKALRDSLHWQVLECHGSHSTDRLQGDLIEFGGSVPLFGGLIPSEDSFNQEIEDSEDEEEEARTEIRIISDLEDD